MRLNTISSVEKELSEIDLGVIEDILNTIRRKSGLQEAGEIPPIIIRGWTRKELVDNILRGKKVATGELIQSAEQVNQQINIIVPPIKITRTKRYTFTLIHELVHSFGKNLKGYTTSGPLQKLNEGLTDIIAARAYQEYCYRTGITSEIHNMSYLEYSDKIINITKELEKRGYGDSELILKGFIQGYFEGIDIISTLKDLLKGDTNINDIIFLTKELFSM